jgi:hypothetical protein
MIGQMAAFENRVRQPFASRRQVDYPLTTPVFFAIIDAGSKDTWHKISLSLFLK